jgi:hypothetical protein
MEELCVKLELELQIACTNADTSCLRHGGYVMHAKIATTVLEHSFYRCGLFESEDNSRMSRDADSE